MKVGIFSLWFFIAFFGFGQDENAAFIQGKLIDADSKKPIPFAKLYNHDLKQGTLTNFEGFFKLAVRSDADSITVSSIGYQTQVLLYDRRLPNQMIALTESVQLEEEVVILPKDISYLYELVDDCRRKAPKTPIKGKAVYELKSYMDSIQTELVEAYFNYASQGYDLTDYELKAGRLALRAANGRTFMSTESSKAISFFKTGTENAYFPYSPAELNQRKMAKSFYLKLEKKYLDENLDSIYVIDFQPKDSLGNYFKGSIWVNKSKLYFLKINTSCQECKSHPFLPIFATDSLRRVQMNITKTFRPYGNTSLFNHVDFNYSIDYVSNHPNGKSEPYQVQTKAIMYAYDMNNRFESPKISFTPMTHMDYRKIIALPYHLFFWENNDEYKLSPNKRENEQFYRYFHDFRMYQDSNIRATRASSKGIFEAVHIRWSPDRVVMRDWVEPVSVAQAENFNLSVKIYMDKSTYGDSTHFLTCTLFDPFESFWKMPMNPQSTCFINMYFDLCEIARREMEKALYQPGSDADVLYANYLFLMEKQLALFVRETEKGTVEKEMRKWNEYIVQNIGIDNLGIFKPFQVK